LPPTNGSNLVQVIANFSASLILELWQFSSSARVNLPPFSWSLPEAGNSGGCSQAGGGECPLSGEWGTAAGTAWTWQLLMSRMAKSFLEASGLNCSSSGSASEEDGCSSVTFAAAVAEQQQELQETPRAALSGLCIQHVVCTRVSRAGATC